MLTIGGCSSAPSLAPAQGALLVQIGPGDDPGENDETVCNVATTASGVPPIAESRGVSPEVSVQDGWQDDGGATTRIRCTVRPTQPGFSVAAVIGTSDGLGATLIGTMSVNSSDVTATFVGTAGTFVSQGPCSVDFSAAQGMDIEPGRVWAVVTCPRAMDGRGHTCLAAAAILLENCDR